ncbi:hypothetical protein POM88_025221 [Heracleum sosnowskyi]|uniref:Uncharacterized protein n=1 Tax=Heracleum sosnowskyi TaxID=360622 RepID=A0AAD8I5R6_9APIA|nr:hypothetical protein POM88_025221 [Heracleum sosnowskyi]
MTRDSDYDIRDKEAWNCYLNEVEKSENFEVGDYPYPGTTVYGAPRQPMTSCSIAAKIYDASDPDPDQQLYDYRLLCFSRLALCFYNIREGTYFHDVKVLMATQRGISNCDTYITFQAFSSKSRRNRESAVTFQTHVIDFDYMEPCPRFQIMFVRIKPDGNKAKKSQPSEYDPKAKIVHDCLFQVIKTYTIDSRLDCRYSLALHLSQYALVSHNIDVLQEDVAKHDMESLKVLKLVKSVAKVPTYLITFEAPLCAETERKNVETFETEICMPTLFPTTMIELISVARVITA